RTLAPFAQCEPRLIGLSQEGSCPVQTPFWTSAVTVQPTAQWVQMLFFSSIATPGWGGLIAAALRTDPSWNVPIAANPPAARPERRRNVRRSRGAECPPLISDCNFVWPACPLLRFVNMGVTSLFRGIAVHTIERLDVIGFPIA